jgi:hypothetical protein
LLSARAVRYYCGEMNRWTQLLALRRQIRRVETSLAVPRSSGEEGEQVERELDRVEKALDELAVASTPKDSKD